MNRTGKTHGMIGLGTMGLQMARQWRTRDSRRYDRYRYHWTNTSGDAV